MKKKFLFLFIFGLLIFPFISAGYELVYQENPDASDINASVFEQYVNYTKPISALSSSMWGSHDFGVGAAYSNTSFDTNAFTQSCWDYDPTTLVLRFWNDPTRTTVLQCYNGTVWGTVYTDSQGGGWGDIFNTCAVGNLIDGNHATAAVWDTGAIGGPCYADPIGDPSGFYEEFMWWNMTVPEITYPVNGSTYNGFISQLNYTANDTTCYYSTDGGDNNYTYYTPTPLLWLTQFQNNELREINTTDGSEINLLFTTYGAPGLAYDRDLFDLWLSTNDAFVTKFGIADYPITGPSLTVAVDENGNVWTANTDNSVSFVNGTDGTEIANIPTSGTSLQAIKADGRGSVWVVSFTNGKLIKINNTDGSIIGTYSIATSNLRDLAIDNDGNVWVTRGSAAFPSVIEVDGTTGSIIKTVPFPITSPLLTLPHHIAVGYSNAIYVTTRAVRELYKIDSETGDIIWVANVDTPSNAAAQASIQGIDIDGDGNVWVTNYVPGGNNLKKFDGVTGDLLGTFAEDSFRSYGDGTGFHIKTWVMNSKEYTNQPSPCTGTFNGVLTPHQGWNTWTVYSQGSPTVSDSVTFFIDSSPPVIDITYPLANTGSTPYIVNVSEMNYTVSDDSALDQCWYSTDLGVTNTTISCGTNITGLISIEGDFLTTWNTWDIWANDTFGLEGHDQVIFFRNIIAPDVYIIFPVNGTNYTSNETFLTYYNFDPYNFGNGCWYSRDGGATNITIANCGYSNTPPYIDNETGLIADEGLNTWTVYVTNIGGWVNSSTVTFFVNTTTTPPPTPTPPLSGVAAICEGGRISMGDAAALAGILLTIILVGTVLAALVLTFTGIVNMGSLEGTLSIDKLPAAVLIIGLTYLLLATMAYILGVGVCGSLV